MRTRQSAVVVAVCAAYALYCIAARPAGPISAPDSAGYVAMSPIHVLGYPLFLRMVGVQRATIAQPLIFAAALAALGLETLQLSSSLLLAVAIVLAPVSVPGLTTYHASILTESLFMSALIALLAAAMAFVRAPSVRSIVAAAAIAGLAATVRRTGIALLPLIPIMVWLEWRRLPRPAAALACAVAAATGLVAAERIAAHAVHGDRLASEAGRHMYAKAAMIDAPDSAAAPADPLRAALDDHLAVRFQPIRDLIRRAPPDAARVLTLYYETCLQGPCVPELGTSATGSEGPRMNDALLETGLARIERAPFAFLNLTLRHYRSLWLVYRINHPDTVPALRQFVDANQPLPFEEAARLAPAAFGPKPRAAVRIAQWIVTALAWWTGAIALVGIGARAAGRALPPDLAAACIAALAAHGALLFTALAAAGVSRLMIGVWPAVTTAAVAGAWSAWRMRPGWRRMPPAE